MQTHDRGYIDNDNNLLLWNMDLFKGPHQLDQVFMYFEKECSTSIQWDFQYLTMLA